MKAACDHRCCDYSHMRRPAVSAGQCDCRCHDGRCDNTESHAGECNCPGDYYDWPHHYVRCPKGIAMEEERAQSEAKRGLDRLERERALRDGEGRV